MQTLFRENPIFSICYPRQRPTVPIDQFCIYLRRPDNINVLVNIRQCVSGALLYLLEQPVL